MGHKGNRPTKTPAQRTAQIQEALRAMEQGGATTGEREALARQIGSTGGGSDVQQARAEEVARAEVSEIAFAEQQQARLLKEVDDLRAREAELNRLKQGGSQTPIQQQIQARQTQTSITMPSVFKPDFLGNVPYQVEPIGGMSTVEGPKFVTPSGKPVIQGQDEELVGMFTPLGVSLFSTSGRTISEEEEQRFTSPESIQVRAIAREERQALPSYRADIIRRQEEAFTSGFERDEEGRIMTPDQESYDQILLFNRGIEEQNILSLRERKKSEQFYREIGELPNVAIFNVGMSTLKGEVEYPLLYTGGEKEIRTFKLKSGLPVFDRPLKSTNIKGTLFGQELEFENSFVTQTAIISYGFQKAGAVASMFNEEYQGKGLRNAYGALRTKLSEVDYASVKKETSLTYSAVGEQFEKLYDDIKRVGISAAYGFGTKLAVVGISTRVPVVGKALPYVLGAVGIGSFYASQKQYEASLRLEKTPEGRARARAEYYVPLAEELGGFTVGYGAAGKITESKLTYSLNVKTGVKTFPLRMTPYEAPVEPKYPLGIGLMEQLRIKTFKGRLTEFESLISGIKTPFKVTGKMVEGIEISSAGEVSPLFSPAKGQRTLFGEPILDRELGRVQSRFIEERGIQTFQTEMEFGIGRQEFAPNVEGRLVYPPSYESPFPQPTLGQRTLYGELLSEDFFSGIKRPLKIGKPSQFIEIQDEFGKTLKIRATENPFKKMSSVNKFSNEITRFYKGQLVDYSKAYPYNPIPKIRLKNYPYNPYVKNRIDELSRIGKGEPYLQKKFERYIYGPEIKSLKPGKTIYDLRNIPLSTNERYFKSGGKIYKFGEEAEAAKATRKVSVSPEGTVVETKQKYKEGYLTLDEIGLRLGGRQPKGKYITEQEEFIFQPTKQLGKVSSKRYLGLEYGGAGVSIPLLELESRQEILSVPIQMLRPQVPKIMQVTKSKAKIIQDVVLIPTQDFPFPFPSVPVPPRFIEPFPDRFPFPEVPRIGKPEKVPFPFFFPEGYNQGGYSFDFGRESRRGFRATPTLFDVEFNIPGESLMQEATGFELSRRIRRRRRK